MLILYYQTHTAFTLTRFGPDIGLGTVTKGSIVSVNRNNDIHNVMNIINRILAIMYTSLTVPTVFEAVSG